MKASLLEFLTCSVCQQDFHLGQITSQDGDEIMEGTLNCSCGSKPIIHGVPRLLPQAVDPKNWDTAFRFGEEWNQFSMLTDKYEDQFLNWLEPVQRDFFKDKIILDVGCGKGRHLLYSQKFGAKTVISIDLSHAVDAAFKNVGHLPNVHIIQADIQQMPLKPIFDYAYSIGVLHHTPDPGKSFQHMVDKVKPGGAVSAWVYGREGNGWIIYIVNPIRKVTSVLPLFITKAIAFVLAVVLQASLKLVYAPANRNPKLHWLNKCLPYSAYLFSIADYSFKENHSIVFDHLLPEIAFYIRKEAFTKWFDDAKLQDVVITQRNNMSWRGFGRKII